MFHISRTKKHPKLWVGGEGESGCFVKFYDKSFVLYGDGLSLVNRESQVYYRLGKLVLKTNCRNSDEVHKLLECDLADHEGCECSDIVDNVMMASLTLGYKYYTAINTVYDELYVNKKCIEDDIESAHITELGTMMMCGEEFLVSDEFIEAFAKPKNRYSLANGLIYQFIGVIKNSKLDNRFNKSYM